MELGGGGRAVLANLVIMERVWQRAVIVYKERGSAK